MFSRVYWPYISSFKNCLSNSLFHSQTVWHVFSVYFFQFFTYYRYLPSTRCTVDEVLSHSVGCLFTWILFPFLCRSHLLHVILFVIPWDYLLCCWSPCQNVLAYAYDLKCVNYVLRHSLVLIFICYYAWHGNTLSPKHLPLSIS